MGLGFSFVYLNNCINIKFLSEHIRINALCICFFALKGIFLQVEKIEKMETGTQLVNY